MTATAERALRATGLLAVFNEAGVLSLADVHTADRIARLSGEPYESVRLAAALCVRALRLGSVCIDLNSIAATAATDDDIDLPWPEPLQWLRACTNSPLVAADGEPARPLRLTHGRLYLDRYWREEQQVAHHLRQRADAASPPVDETRLQADLARLLPDDYQRQAAEMSARRRITVLAGGPGTGKTTTIARLLAVLCAQPGGAPRIALAAPTGKAAARLTEAVREETQGLPESDRSALGDLTASTIHRLLGRQPGSHTRFRHNQARHLPYDVIVIDETSMVSLTLMARLLEAIRPDARLILVGDPDQLASVEAGAVLGDILTASTASFVVTLQRTWRFGGDIASLATAIRSGDADTAITLLRAGGRQLQFIETPARECAELRVEVTATLKEVTEAAERGDAATALRALDSHRLLCAHRHGPDGVTGWTAEVETWLPNSGIGEPLLVTANDYDTGLYNGDVGVTVITEDGLRAAFPRGAEIALIPPSRLSNTQPLYAMTVHRSQGSQFDRISLVLPPETSPLLTRELLYTAVTRAKTGLRILGSEEAVRRAVGRPIARASGLRDSLVEVSEDVQCRTRCRHCR